LVTAWQLHIVINLPYSRHVHRHAGRTTLERGIMTDTEYARKLDELDRLLNDPDVPMEPAKVWSLLAELNRRDRAMAPGERA
jgi:hypothetical protein